MSGKGKSGQEAHQPSAPQQGSGRGCFGLIGSMFGLFSGRILLALVLGLILIVVVQGLFVWGNPVDKVLSFLGFERDTKPEVVDSRVLVLGIRDLALLQTASGDVQIDKIVVDSGPSPDARLRMSYIGSVAVGIDLSRLTETDITMSGNNTVTIAMPPIQILDCALRYPEIIDSDCISIPLVQDCNTIVPAMQAVAYKRSLEDLLRRAEGGDITTPAGEPLLDVAYVNAERAIADLLAKFGYERVSFVRSEEVVPASSTCTP